MPANYGPRPVPKGLEDVALIDGPACAAAAGCGLTRWHEMVRRGEAPGPVIRRPRFTRWRLADVRAWLALVEGDDPAVVAQARRASRAAQMRRLLPPAGGPR
jgi:predicted DNA-binding transcriptional regulator AlpA